MPRLLNVKTCSTCNTPKPLTDFHRRRDSADGHMGKCKACRKAWQRANLDKGARASADWRRSHKGQAWKARALVRMKASARAAVLRAVKAGTLIKTACEKCNATETEAHHPDYNRPLYVVWLCIPCHQAEHNRTA